MNWLNFFTKLYSKERNIPGLPFWVMTPVRRLTKYAANKVLPHYLSSSRPDVGGEHVPIMVSFTSYPARINHVWQVVECMMRQTYKPEKIILWLSTDQFPNSEDVPDSLKKRVGDRFQIRFVEGDLRSHKKYHYMAREYPDSLVFLIDDDLYYSTDILERTMKAYQRNPDAIICNYGYHIAYKEDGGMLPYNTWSKEYGYSTSNDLFFGSGGGTLFRPSWLYQDLTNSDLAMQLTPMADDIWLNTMALLAERQKIMIPNGNILPIPIKGKVKLASINREEHLNDKQLNQVIQHYIDNLGINPFCMNN